MRRRESNALGYTPDEHAKRKSAADEMSIAAANRAILAADFGECLRAFNWLRDAEFLRGRRHAHRDASNPNRLDPSSAGVLVDRASRKVLACIVNKATSDPEWRPLGRSYSKRRQRRKARR